MSITNVTTLTSCTTNSNDVSEMRSHYPTETLCMTRKILLTLGARSQATRLMTDLHEWMKQCTIHSRLLTNQQLSNARKKETSRKIQSQIARLVRFTEFLAKNPKLNENLIKQLDEFHHEVYDQV